VTMYNKDRQNYITKYSARAGDSKVRMLEDCGRLDPFHPRVEAACIR
jgi:hypothetical protein